MNVNDVYTSKYISAADLKDNIVPVTIRDVTLEKLGDDNKFVLYFTGKQKGLPLNKTNTYTISAVFGEETDHWIGKAIQIFGTVVDYQGKQVPAVRVRVQKVAAVQNYQAPVIQPPTPPAALPPAYVAAAHSNGRAAPAHMIEDEIPF